MNLHYFLCGNYIKPTFSSCFETFLCFIPSLKFLAHGLPLCLVTAEPRVHKQFATSLLKALPCRFKSGSLFSSANNQSFHVYVTVGLFYDHFFCIHAFLGRSLPLCPFNRLSNTFAINGSRISR